MKIESDSEVNFTYAANCPYQIHHYVQDSIYSHAKGKSEMHGPQ